MSHAEKEFENNKDFFNWGDGSEEPCEEYNKVHDELMERSDHLDKLNQELDNILDANIFFGEAEAKREAELREEIKKVQGEVYELDLELVRLGGEQ